MKTNQHDHPWRDTCDQEKDTAGNRWPNWRRWEQVSATKKRARAYTKLKSDMLTDVLRLQRGYYLPDANYDA